LLLPDDAAIEATVVAGAFAEIFSAAPGEDELHPRAITIARAAAVETSNRSHRAILEFMALLSCGERRHTLSAI